MQHPIFHEPNSVKLTLTDEPTPSGYVGEGLGATMPMWRVQTEGYTEGTDQLIGIVSRDAGFLDSPDVEWISSGVNSKNSRAVAIGRHGNFFHWGFAVSPTYLTDEAKLVFVNAVHYITQFDHQAPIARKRPGTMMRSAVAGSLERITERGYRDVQKLYAGYAEDDRKRRAAIQARADAGEQLSQRDQGMLSRPAMQVPGRFQPVRRYFSDEQWAKVAGDEQAIRAWLVERLPYMRSQGWYKLVVDEDLLGLGVANNDPALLDKAVAMLGDKAQAALARRLLERYTDQSFATAQQWQRWLQEHREHLFFTEAGGYRWLVDSVGQRGNRGSAAASSAQRSNAAPPARKAPAQKVPAQKGSTLKPSQQKPLAARMRIESEASDRHVVVIEIAILEGWHAYESLPHGSPYTQLVPELRVPSGLKQQGKWQRPVGSPYPKEPELTVYEGEVTLRCSLVGELPKDLSGLTCSLHYQVCDDSMCMPPSSLKLAASR